MAGTVGVARFEVHQVLRTIIVAPLTSHGRSYPTRVPVKFYGTDGQVVLDQICTVDKVRLIRRLGTLDQVTARRVLGVLGEMFAP